MGNDAFIAGGEAAPAAREEFVESNVWDEVWERSSADLTSRSEDAEIVPFTGVATAAACVRKPNPRGEDCSCGDRYSDGALKVRCVEAFVEIPAGLNVVDIQTDVREAAGGAWTQPGGLGWCDYVGRSDYLTPSGGRHIGVTLKNWSHDRSRLVRITVYTSSSSLS